MIKLCIFDMDGLLIDSERAMWTPSQTKALAEQGFVLTDDVHTQYMGMNFKDAGTILEKNYPGIDFEKVYNRVLYLNSIQIEKGLPLMKGAKELLDYLKARGIKTCVGTSTVKESTLRILNNIGIREYFDEVVCGDDIVNGKPAPDIYLKCFSEFNFNKDEVLVFEDADAGARAALAAGLRLVVIPNVAVVEDDTRSKAYKVLNNLQEAIDIIEKENETATSI